MLPVHLYTHAKHPAIANKFQASSVGDLPSLLSAIRSEKKGGKKGKKKRKINSRYKYFKKKKGGGVL